MSKSIVLTKNEIEILCTAGSLAPSGGNAQPWKVIVRKNRIEIRLDPKRSDSFIDVGRYASIFSLGCFTENFCLAADSLGLDYAMEVSDCKDLNGIIVQLTFLKRKKDAEENTLFPYISQRVTNRRLYNGTILQNSDIDTLKKQIENINTSLKLTTFSSSEKKKEIANVLGKADALRTLNPKLFAQMMDEFRWSDQEVTKTKDGLDLKTLELPTNMDKMFLLLKKISEVRKLLPRESLESMAKPLILNCSHICCLSTNTKLTYNEMFLAGFAMERLWLLATKMNIAVHPWSVSTFVLMRTEIFAGKGFSEEENKKVIQLGRDIRHSFQLTAKDMPVFIFRLSEAPPPTARSLRLPWVSFTTIDEN